MSLSVHLSAFQACVFALRVLYFSTIEVVDVLEVFQLTDLPVVSSYIYADDVFTMPGSILLSSNIYAHPCTVAQ